MNNASTGFDNVDNGVAVLNVFCAIPNCTCVLFDAVCTRCPIIRTNDAS